MIIILIGPPASGKGAQAKLLSEEFRIPTISTGDILREKAKLDLSLKQLLDAGSYVSDQMINDILIEHLDAPEYVRGFILDGYPRTLQQAQFFHGVYGTFDVKAFEFQLSQETAFARMRSRAIRHNRLDDNDEVFAKRLTTYTCQIAPVLEFYKQNNTLTKINVEASIEEVNAEILKFL